MCNEWTRVAIYSANRVGSLDHEHESKKPSDVLSASFCARNVVLSVHVNVHSTSSHLSYAQQGRLKSSYSTEDKTVKARLVDKTFPLRFSAVKNGGVWEGTI